MSSRKQVPPEPASETTFLLGEPLSGQSSKTEFSPETLLIPVALAMRLAAMITQTTLVEILRQAICRLWNISHGDPAAHPMDGSILSEACDSPEITRYFSTLIAILSVTDGIMATVECSILSRITSRYGRKPAFLFVLVAGVLANCMIPMSQYMPHWISDWVFLAGMLTGYLSGFLPCAYLVNLYVVDISDPKNRTAALSKMSGWGTLGICISSFFGGSITTKTGNPLIVFYIAAALFTSTFIYAVSVLPESFPKEKRDALSHMRQDSETSSDGSSPVTLLSSFSLIFEPLKILVPIRRSDGTRNWRLAWCGLHTLLFMTTFMYASTSWLVIATSIYHLTPAHTGLFISVATVSGAISLTMILPLLVRLLRPYYIRKTAHSHLEEEVRNESEELETSDHLDVHLAFVSCVIAGVFYLFAAASTTYQALTFSALCIGFAYVHVPTVRSLVAGSVDPLKQGEALAAIEMVSGIGTVLSPIIMGSILTATINTTPLVSFYVNLVVVLVSGGILFLVRDSDRYQESNQM